ncbi:unnamed protein product [Urochloa humidicola]
MAAMDRKLFAWLVFVFLVCSCAAPALCSRPLAAIIARDLEAKGEAWVAAGANAAAAGSDSGAEASGGHREVWSRRSLGLRSPWSPPAPLWNNPTTMPVPPPPWV